MLPREAKKFVVQMVKGINAQVIEVTSVIAAGDLELPFGDEGDDYETLAEASVETTPSARNNKRKEVAQAQDSVVQPNPLVESSPPLSKAKRLRKRAVSESEGKEEEPLTVPTKTTEIDEELREAFKAVEQEKMVLKGEKEKTKDGEEEQKAQRAEPTSLELALFDDVEAEHSTAILAFEVEEGRIAGTLAVVTSPLKPPIVALAEFEAMDLDAQLDKLKQLSPIPGKAKSKVVDEAVDRVKIWQSTELDLDENKEAIDQLMKDLDLLHRQNVAPRPILEISLGLARDVLNLHNCYEDLKPSFKASEFCKATHEANLADYHKQKVELDMMVADYKETKTAAGKLEKHIEEHQKQLASLRGKQSKLGAGLGTKTKATFLVQNMVAASRPTLEIAEASLHQRMPLQQEISTKKAGLQETLRKLGL
ncbi:unnamed protein product [Prunus armeniaca]